MQPIPTTDGARPRRQAGRRLLGVAAAFSLVVLLGACESGGDRGSSAQPTSTTAAPTTSSPPTTTAPTTTTRPKPKPARKLRVGDKGHDVLTAQKTLIALGYADLREATGTFDAQTSHAVIAFQKVNGIGRDGVIGKQTLAALRAPKAPKPRSTAAGFHVETDLTKQVTYMVSAGKAQVINASTASGATYEVDGDTRLAVTPTGDFKIQRKINAWRKSDLGMLYRPAYFTGGYAYHGSYSVPPYPASHGCIRMSIATMDRYYDKLTVGTKVMVYRT